MEAHGWLRIAARLALGTMSTAAALRARASFTTSRGWTEAPSTVPRKSGANSMTRWRKFRSPDMGCDAELCLTPGVSAPWRTKLCSTRLRVRRCTALTAAASRSTAGWKRSDPARYGLRRECYFRRNSTATMRP